MSANFPPGSLGAINAGCSCDSPQDIDLNCPLHGVLLSVNAAFVAIDIARERRAKRRVRRGLPIAILLMGVPVVLSIAFPLWVAECLLWGAIVGTLLVQWAWRGP